MTRMSRNPRHKLRAILGHAPFTTEPDPRTGENANRAPGSGPSDTTGRRPLVADIVTRTADRTLVTRRCDCAEHLRSMAAQEATGSRDFGRGFMHAAAVLDERRAA